jgi:ABC-2 type transport system permease protein
MRAALVALMAILIREGLRFLGQRERMVSALLRPMLWLVIFAAGFRAALGVAITPPYESYITYEVYILPGLMGIVQLFNGMQTSLSMVYDRETGSMRVLLTSPLPRWWLLACKLLAGALVSLVQVYAFLAAALAFGVEVPLWGMLAAAPVFCSPG